MATRYSRNPRKRVIRGSSSDELRPGGRRTSEEFVVEGDDELPFVRLGSSAIGTQQDVVQRIGSAIIGGDFGGNARGRGAIDIQITRDYDDPSGDSQVASGIDSIAIGASSTASGLRSVALGVSAIASGVDAVAVNGTAAGQTGLALLGSAGAIQSIAIGQDSAATVDGGYGVALGPQAKSQAFAAVALGYQAQSAVNYQGVIAATALKMQTALSPLTYESIITTAAAAPVTGNVVTWADVDRIGDGGVALSALAPLASPAFTTQISTPAIVAPAALAVTPAAGNNASVVLSSGGLFNINGPYRMNNSTSTVYAQYNTTTTGGTGITHDIDIYPVDATSVALMRYFRSTDTTGAVALQVMRGNNTNTIQHYLRGNGDSYVAALVGNFGVGASSLSGKLHVGQESTTAAIPAVYINQADVSEEMIEINTTIGTGNAIEAAVLKLLTTTHFIKITIPGGLTRYIPCGTIA